MPTIYVDRPFLDAVRSRCEELEREVAKREERHPSNVNIPEREGLESLLSEEGKRILERHRDQHNV